MTQSTRWQQAYSTHTDPQTAVAELHQQLQSNETELIIFYCSPEYPRDELAKAFNQHFPEQQVIGCTTAGELSAKGYSQHSIVALRLNQADFRINCLRIDNLQKFNMAETLQACLYAQKELDGALDPERCFGFLLIDGLSQKEEVVTSTLYEALEGISIFGGSVADGLNFEHTYIFHDEQFHTDCALLTLIQTEHPFQVFKTEHFHATDKRVVVTAADANKRLVYELNGAPAAQEYARLLGISVDQLSSSVYAIAPLVVRVAGQFHVRSIQQHNPADDSLAFYCAIDTGLVLRIGEGGDIINNLHSTLERLSAELGELGLVLGCDCILRRLEIERKNLERSINQLIQNYHIFGFNTYGEQLNALHVNQTFSGVAIAQ